MATNLVRRIEPQPSEPIPAALGIVETDIPARLDRLPWARFHTLVVVALGITWILPERREKELGSALCQLGRWAASAIMRAAGLASFRRFGRGMPASIQRSISWNSSSISTSDETFFSTRPCA